MYESALSCYVFAAKEFHNSFAAVHNMDLAMLLDLIGVYEKITDTEDKGKTVFIDDIL